MMRFIPMALLAARLVCICGCATTSKAKDLEPSPGAEPVSEPQADPSKPAPVPPPAAPPPPAQPPAKKDARAQEPPPPIDIENKPLPVLPADPPPPPNAEDLGDDNWGRDQRHTKIRDKDREKVKGSEPEDDGWGKE